MDGHVLAVADRQIAHPAVAQLTTNSNPLPPTRGGVLQRMPDALRGMARALAGRGPEPAAVITTVKVRKKEIGNGFPDRCAGIWGHKWVISGCRNAENWRN